MDRDLGLVLAGSIAGAASWVFVVTDGIPANGSIQLTPTGAEEVIVKGMVTVGGEVVTDPMLGRGTRAQFKRMHAEIQQAAADAIARSLKEFIEQS